MPVFLHTASHPTVQSLLWEEVLKNLRLDHVNKTWPCDPLDFASTGGVEAAASGGHSRAAGLRFGTPVQQPWRAMRRKRCLRWTDGQRRKETLKCRRTWASQPIWEASICCEKFDVASCKWRWSLSHPGCFPHSGDISCCCFPRKY